MMDAPAVCEMTIPIPKSLPVFSLGFALLLVGAAERTRADFAVNETTIGDQRTAVVGSDAEGRFVVVWASDDPMPGYDPEIMGRRFDADGNPLGTEFQVSSSALSQERAPKVAVDALGGFLVVWSGFSDGQFAGIAGRRYDADGAPLATDFIVNSYTTSSQLTPDVIATGAGGFLVAWTGYGDQDGSGSGIFAQRFDSGGTVGTEFRINSYTTGFQREPKLALVDDSGRFAVVWEELQSYTVSSRLFDASGSPVGPETTVVDPSLPVDVASLRPEGFVIVWGVGGIYGQRFDAAGEPLGSELTVAVDPSQRHVVNPPDVSSDADGSLLVAWENGELNARRFDPNGASLGDAFVVNSYTYGFQGKPVGTAVGAGDFVVVWHSFDQDGAGYGVFARRLEGGPLDCSPLPRSGCRAALDNALVVRSARTARRDVLKWNWSRGEETVEAAFGDPQNATPYALCVYEGTTLAKALTAPAATACGGRPCWRALANGGFRYRDRRRDELATNGGLHKLKLRPGAAGAARIVAQARGEALAPQELLPFVASSGIVIQAVNLFGECWQSTFDAADIERNDGAHLRAVHRE
jgi:hypothetical protein